MNICRNVLIASTVSLALACGAFAQSTGGGGTAGGSNGGTQGASAGRNGTAGGGTAGSTNGNGSASLQGSGGAGGTQGTSAGQGANGAAGMQGTSKGCENLATSGPQKLPEQNRPVGTPTEGAANKGSTDWSDQSNCVNGQGRQNGGATRNPSSSGG